MVVLDKFDVKILECLRKDGTASFREVAKGIGISAPTVRSRIENLREIGIIKGISVDIDPSRLTGVITSIMGLRVPLNTINDIATKLKEFTEVQEIYITTGAYNILIKVALTNVNELNTFLMEKISKIGEVTSYDSSIVVDTIKSSSDVKLYPGLVAVTECIYCKKKIFESPVIKNIDGKKQHFCCNTCASVYEDAKTKEHLKKADLQ